MGAGLTDPRPSLLAKVALGSGVGLAALALAFWGVPVAAVVDAIASMDPQGLVLPAMVFLVQQTLRAWRQAIILQARFPEHRFRSSLSVLCIGFFFVNTLPARIGEVVRPMLLAEREDIPLGAGFAMVVVERAFDLVAMGVMVSVLAWLVPIPPVVGELMPGLDLVSFARSLVGAGVPGVVLALLALMFAGDRILALVTRLSQRWTTGTPGRLRSRVLAFATQFVAGIAGVRSAPRLASLLALTATAWALTGLMYPPIAAAFGVGEYIDYSAGIGILGITMVGMALPAAPGFAGTYEAAVRGALALYGVAGQATVLPGGPSLDAIAVAFALVAHWWVHVVQSCTAIWFLVVDQVDPRAIFRRVLRPHPAPADPDPADPAPANDAREEQP